MSGMSMPAREKNLRLAVMLVSVSVSALLMAAKFYTYWITDSAAILSDAMESIINVVASGFALLSVVLSSKPPDSTHPYGHGKIEYFSVGFEGALILLAAGGIIYEALPRLWRPSPIPALDYGLIILMGTCAVNLALGITLTRVGKRTRSSAITADGKHILTDVYTTGGVLAGLLIVRQTGWYFLDGAVACLVAVNIVIIGIRLIQESFSRLMDASDPQLLDQISSVITSHKKPEWLQIHHLRAWRSGDRIHADFHLILPSSLSLEDAHREVTDIEQILKANVPGMGDALVHAEPCVGPGCPVCSLDSCDAPEETDDGRHAWQVKREE